MKIFTTESIRNIDRATIEEEGVSSQELIHRVAEGVVNEILANWNPSKPTIIFAGSGNNGADALIVGKLLIEAGFNPHIILFNFKGNSLSRDCREARQRLLSLGNVNLTEIIESAELPTITPNHLVIDGMFGTGLRDPLIGGYTVLARNISESGATVISIDVPSGLFSDWNSRVLARDVVHATLTMAVQFPRLAFFLSDNAPMVGKWKTIDIGLSRRAIKETPTKYYYVETEDIRQVLRRRPDFCSKADFGHALLISGCYGMMGAAVMAGKGALRAGAGKVTIHSAKCGFSVIQSQVPEALFLPDPNEIVISNMTPRYTYSAIGVGPGIGTNDATKGAFETLVKTIKRPMVIDADALNILAMVPSLIDHVAPGCILTPHAGEFDRIFGSQASAESRLLKALEVAHRYKLIIVLKGFHTAVVRPDGKVFFNSTGNPGMATGGSGDVLTGVITSLLAQGYKPETAAVAGVHIHGLAGDIATERHGEYGVTALDIAANIGKAIKMIMNK
ncbi:MAG: NAD(P)H-hydrate dehydratase [Muribaculaceae bacterium]|nr:NAD(P)H-hydrate dehydratase [Muribaculaceae bacterium]